MAPVFQVTDLYKLMAMYKALMLAKWADPPLAPEIPGSPFIAEALNDIAETIDRIEIERGYPQRAGWANEEMPLNSKRWELAVKLAAFHRNWWLNTNREQRVAYVRVIISPFIIAEQNYDKFFDQVDQRFQEEED